MKANRQQKEINDPKYSGKNIIVPASAGTGKTTTLTARIINYIKDKKDIDNYLVVSYTETAAEELKESFDTIDNSVDKLNDRIQQMKKEENTKYDRYTDSVDTEFGRIEKAYINYPPFTAEKQIELIKWLGELDMLEIIRTTREDKAWIINSEYGMSGNVYKHTSRMKSFEEALAGLINSLWQDLTEEEQEQIREILK